VRVGSLSLFILSLNYIWSGAAINEKEPQQLLFYFSKLRIGSEQNQLVVS